MDEQQDLSLRLDEGEATIRQIMQMTGCPGLCFGIVKNDRFLAQRSYGFTGIDERKHTTEKTNFGISSLTKMFTATVCALLVV